MRRGRTSVLEQLSDWFRVWEMAQQVKVLPAKPGVLSSSPRTHRVNIKDSVMCARAHAYGHTLTRTYRERERVKTFYKKILNEKTGLGETHKQIWSRTSHTEARAKRK